MWRVLRIFDNIKHNDNLQLCSTVRCNSNSADDCFPITALCFISYINHTKHSVDYFRAYMKNLKEKNPICVILSKPMLCYESVCSSHSESIRRVIYCKPEQDQPASGHFQTARLLPYMIYIMNLNLIHVD